MGFIIKAIADFSTLFRLQATGTEVTCTKQCSTLRLGPLHGSAMLKIPLLPAYRKAKTGVKPCRRTGRV